MRHRDLDQKPDVIRPRMSLRVVARLAAHDALIGLGFGFGRETDGHRRAHMPPRGDRSPECSPAKHIGHTVRGILNHLGHQHSVDELDFVTRCQSTGLDQFFILVDRHRPAWVGRRLRGPRDRGHGRHSSSSFVLLDRHEQVG